MTSNLCETGAAKHAPDRLPRRAQAMLQTMPGTAIAAQASADDQTSSGKKLAGKTLAGKRLAGKRLAIIGTAGRKEDGKKLNLAIYDAMCVIAMNLVKRDGITQLVSGGAAYADHVAVSLVLNGVLPYEALTLYLPAPLQANGFDPACKDGGTANYYHHLFAQKTKVDGIAQLHQAIEHGAQAHVNAAGFLARNLQVAAAADVLLAFTFGDDFAKRPPKAWELMPYGAVTAAEAGLKDGGTAHTWNRTKAPLRYHVRLA